MQACVDVAFPYAHMRDAFGKKIGEHQVGFLCYIMSHISFLTLHYCCILLGVKLGQFVKHFWFAFVHVTILP